MRTWRQGVVGKMNLPKSETLYVKCLKYPLAIFYEQYNLETLAFGTELFKALLQLDTLKHIERVGSVKLTLTETELGNHFTIFHTNGTTEITNITFDTDTMKSLLLNKGKPCSIEDLQNRRP